MPDNISEKELYRGLSRSDYQFLTILEYLMKGGKINIQKYKNLCYKNGSFYCDITHTSTFFDGTIEATLDILELSMDFTRLYNLLTNLPHKDYINILASLFFKKIRKNDE